MLKRIIGGAALAGVAVFGGVTAMGDETKRDDSGVITEAGGLGAFSVRAGDCIRVPDDASSIESVEGVPCTQPHNGQAYALFDMADGPYPGDVAVEQAAETGCAARFADFVGVSYEDSEFDFSSMVPTADTWTGVKDREIVCVLISPDGDLTVDARGIGR